MYVTGSLCDTENVIVEIGTGYYAEKVGKRIDQGTVFDPF